MGFMLTPLEYVREVQKMLVHDKRSIFQFFPEKIKNILEYKFWAEVTDRQGKKFNSFKQFCEHHLPEGLGLDIEADLLVFLKDAPDVKKLVYAEIGELGKVGGTIGNKNASIINVKNEGKILPSFENNKKTRHTPYFIKRIKRDFPEHYKRFEEGEKITVLATELGIKTKQLTIYESDAVETAKRIKAKFDAEFVKLLKENL